MTGLLIQMGIGWKPDPSGMPGHIISVLDSDYVAEIGRLIEENAALKKDAMRWRALMASQRLRVMGSAGFGYRDRPADPNGYRHIGLELWSIHDHGDNPATEAIVTREHAHALEILDAYIVVINGLSTNSPESE